MFHIVMSADDTSVVFVDEKLQSLEMKGNADLLKIDTCLKSNELYLNINKTYIVACYSRLKPLNNKGQRLKP